MFCLLSTLFSPPQERTFCLLSIVFRPPPSPQPQVTIFFLLSTVFLPQPQVTIFYLLATVFPIGYMFSENFICSQKSQHFVYYALFCFFPTTSHNILFIQHCFSVPTTSHNILFIENRFFSLGLHHLKRVHLIMSRTKESPNQKSHQRVTLFSGQTERLSNCVFGLRMSSSVPTHRN